MHHLPPTPPSSGDTDQATILIVDDEEPLLNLFTMVLEEIGYRVLTAHNGREALGVVDHDEPALIISDVMMPLLDGLGLCRVLKERDDTRHIPIVLMSAARPNMTGLKAEKFLPKPFELEQLEDVVHELLGEKSTS